MRQRIYVKLIKNLFLICLITFLMGAVSMIAAIANAQSPWDEVLEGINYTGGNVGIGITHPCYKLDVKGENDVVRISGTTSPPTGILFKTGPTQAEMYRFNGDDFNNLHIHAGILGAGIYINSTTGNIGIGISLGNKSAR